MSSSYNQNNEFNSNEYNNTFNTNNNNPNQTQSNFSNNSNGQNNLKIQLIKKDKIIMSNNKQLNEQRNKIDSLHRVLEMKDKEIKHLQESMNEIQEFGNNYKSEKNNYLEKINSYKTELDKLNEEKYIEQTNLNEQINDLTRQLNSKESKIKQNEKIIENLNRELNERQSEILEQNEIIENLQLINRKNEDEKNEASILNSKLIESEERIKNYKCKVNELENNIQVFQKNNEELESRLNNLIRDSSNKESSMKNELMNLKSRNTILEQSTKNQNDDYEKTKNKCEFLQKEIEKFTSYVTNKLNDFNDFIDSIKFSSGEGYRLQNNFDKVYNQNDIKYEIIDDALMKLKKNIVNVFTEQKNKNDNCNLEYNKLIQQKQLSENIINNLQNEKEVLNYKYEEIVKKNGNVIKNYESLSESYEKLKQIYMKLYNDYQIFTDKNIKLMNDTRIYQEKLNSYFQELHFENKQDDYSPINEVLLQNIILFINKYKSNEEILNKLEKENLDLKNKYDSQKNITISKIKELTNLIEESKKIIKVYEIENINLKKEIEKLNYQYKMLECQQIKNE